ncbi:hypothetical protein NPIL_402731 [Nephila pilipes]|uniref:Uncharacterized protein n=1 Tax=Nephila pilipes TaxID=299642 RepID=A0A8X6QBP9_NEPPI|nr:hypothetical protein NPIL_402731 [Nephila pilipes]
MAAVDPHYTRPTPLLLPNRSLLLHSIVTFSSTVQQPKGWHPLSDISTGKETVAFPSRPTLNLYVTANNGNSAPDINIQWDNIISSTIYRAFKNLSAAKLQQINLKHELI